MAGFKFRRQHIISDYIADFVCLSEKLIIEIDGLHHQLPENIISDEQRTSDLNKLGFEVIRFTNAQILNETDDIINTIIERLKERRIELSTTENPPLGGGGPVFVSLPGVPYEMKGLMMKEVIPRLQQHFVLPVIIHQTLLTVGIGESMIAEKIKDWEEKLPSHMKFAYLPHFGMVRLRITATGDDKNNLEQELEGQFARLKELVKEWMVIDEDMTLQQAIAKLLKERKQTVGTAESCTGGYIAHLLSRDPGSSSNYKGSIVSYDNKVKVDVLGVSEEILKTVGAVSEETVIQMVKGALQQLKADYVVSTSGIMGPDGGSENKPVGLVWIAVGNKEKIITKQFHFKFERSRNIEQTAVAALDMVRKLILSEP